MEECKALRTMKDCIVKIGPERYIITCQKYHATARVVINTSMAVKSKEENKPILKELGRILFDIHLKQELKKRGLSLEDIY